MGQIYKIFINEVPVIIREGLHPSMEEHDPQHPEFFIAQKKEIDKAFHLIENGTGCKSLTIYGDDARGIKNYLFNGYKRIKAAGGLVFNHEDAILMIYRKGAWDLPKGKLDPGEPRKVAALREVSEETGLHRLSLLRKLIRTYHTYSLGNAVRVLKVTYWYLMMSDDTGKLTPQAEEGIEIARWVHTGELEHKLSKSYANIRMVIETGIRIMHLG